MKSGHEILTGFKEWMLAARVVSKVLHTNVCCFQTTASGNQENRFSHRMAICKRTWCWTGPFWIWITNRQLNDENLCAFWRMHENSALILSGSVKRETDNGWNLGLSSTSLAFTHSRQWSKFVKWFLSPDMWAFLHSGSCYRPAREACTAETIPCETQRSLLRWCDEKLIIWVAGTFNLHNRPWKMTS